MAHAGLRSEGVSAAGQAPPRHDGWRTVPASVGLKAAPAAVLLDAIGAGIAAGVVLATTAHGPLDATILAAGSAGFAAATVFAMLVAGLYRGGPIVAPDDHLAAFAKTLIAVHVLILLHHMLGPAGPLHAAPHALFAAARLAASAGLVILARFGLAAALRRWHAGARPRRSAALIVTGTVPGNLVARLAALADHRLFYVFAWGDAHGTALRAVPDEATLEGLIAAGRIDDVVVFRRHDDDAANRQRLERLMADLADRPVRLRLAFDAAAELGAGAVAQGQALRLVTVLEGPMSPAAAAAKRAMDILGSLIALILLAPVLAAISLALWPGGPVLFRQRRVGAGGRGFIVLKFRTMTVQASGSAPARRGLVQARRGVVQARRGDPRVTRLGALLRRLSLDELPQLFNVLRGDMSLVGPRPHAPGTSGGAMTFEEAVAFYAVRHRVKPGMTGLAQVSGLRGGIDRPEAITARVAADLDYIARWSVWMDLGILLRTLPAVLGGRNAY